MAYKVGTTIVIDDSGNVDWSRIANKPTIGAGTLTSVTVVNGTPGAPVFSINANQYNGVSNCIVSGLTGGGTSGDITITATRSYINCNCNCRC